MPNGYGYGFLCANAHGGGAVGVMGALECFLWVAHLSASAPRIRSTARSPRLSQCVLTRRGAPAHALPARPYPKGRDHLRSRSRRSGPSRVELPDGGRVPRTWAVASLRVRTRWEGLSGSAPSGEGALGEREWMLVDGMREVGTSLDGGSRRWASLGFGRWPSPQASEGGRPLCGLPNRNSMSLPDDPVLASGRSIEFPFESPARGARFRLPGVRANARTPATHNRLSHSTTPQVWSVRRPIA